MPTGKAADAEEVRVLAPKKTIAAKDGMGDWEVVDKRDTMRVKKRNLYDSDDGSELSSDSY